MTKEQPYHLALAHLIGKAGFDIYTDFYREIGNTSGKYLIMDNGLIEGDPRPIEELLAKAQYLHADELVLPDVFQDKDETLLAAHAALEYVKMTGSEIRLMAVAQGADLEEWIECAKEMLTWPIDCLGIPKVLVKMAGRDGRLEALRAIQSEIKKYGIAVHLLGCWESPLEVKMIENQIHYGQLLPVRGVDSAIAYVYARAGLSMSQAERPSGPIDFAALDADPVLMAHNIQMWQYECSSIKEQLASKIKPIW